MSVLVLSLCTASIQMVPDRGSSPSIVLRASASQPYIGQVVQLGLDINLPLGQLAQPLRLRVPWLMREFGFTWQIPPEEWLQRLAGRRDGIPVQINDFSEAIFLPSQRSGNLQRCRLTWMLVVRDPEPMNNGRIDFSSVRLESPQGMVASKPLRLEVRKPPLPPPDLPGANLNLGVGDYQIASNVAPAEITLGETATLTLKVSGSGALWALPLPQLTSLPFFRSTKLLIVERGIDSSDTDGRTRHFHYELRPRQPGLLTIPSFYYTCFDPILEKYQTRATGALSLAVRPATASAKAQATFPPGSVPERLQLAPPDASLLIPSESGYLDLLLGSLVVVQLALMALLALRDARHKRKYPSGRRSSLGKRTLSQLRHRSSETGAIGALVFEFIQERFQAPASPQSWAELEASMLYAGIGQDKIELTRAFHERWHAVRFGPPTAGADHELRTLAQQVVRELDES